MLAKALTIAGSDSGGGAGIQADLKTFAALGVYGMSAITAITAQNTCGVSAVQGIDPEVVAAQIRAVVTDIGVGAAKTGMLFSAEIIQAVATTVRALDLQLLVVDPVMVATSGDRLLQREAEESLRQDILPLATDVFYDGRHMELLQSEVVATSNTHGTGCTFSAAICAYLARGAELLEAVRRAKTYITGALRHSLTIGQGSGPVGHFWNVTYPTD